MNTPQILIDAAGMTHLEAFVFRDIARGADTLATETNRPEREIWHAYNRALVKLSAAATANFNQFPNPNR